MGLTHEVRPTEVLLVEAHDGDADTIEKLFGADRDQEPVRIRRVATIRDALDTLTASRQPDCVLLALDLPDATGTETVDTFHRTAPDIPLVVLTVTDDAEVARDALRAGAQDYLVKGDRLDEEVARRAIRYAIDRATQVTALRRSRQELRDFSHRVAHDLKAPMAVILGAVELLARRQPTGQPDELLRMLSRSSTRLVDMVDRLLEFADTAGTDQMLADVSLDDVVDWVLESFGSELDDADVEVDRPLPAVRGNETGLRHVFLNLVSNARKYAAPGRGLSITITASVTDEHVEVRFADNGVGIPAEHRTAVFGAGYRIDTSEPGTGLGLATVFRTLRLIGGNVAIEDGPNGQGTTFVLQLPRAQATGPARVS